MRSFEAAVWGRMSGQKKEKDRKRGKKRAIWGEWRE